MVSNESSAADGSEQGDEPQQESAEEFLGGGDLEADVAADAPEASELFTASLPAGSRRSGRSEVPERSDRSGPSPRCGRAILRDSSARAAVAANVQNPSRSTTKLKVVRFKRICN